MFNSGSNYYSNYSNDDDDDGLIIDDINTINIERKECNENPLPNIPNITDYSSESLYQLANANSLYSGGPPVGPVGRLPLSSDVNNLYLPIQDHFQQRRPPQQRPPQQTQQRPPQQRPQQQMQQQRPPPQQQRPHNLHPQQRPLTQIPQQNSVISQYSAGPYVSSDREFNANIFESTGWNPEPQSFSGNNSYDWLNTDSILSSMPKNVDNVGSTPIKFTDNNINNTLPFDGIPLLYKNSTTQNDSSPNNNMIKILLVIILIVLVALLIVAAVKKQNKKTKNGGRCVLQRTGGGRIKIVDED